MNAYVNCESSFLGFDSTTEFIEKDGENNTSSHASPLLSSPFNPKH
jgi:hypothetical protein